MSNINSSPVINDIDGDTTTVEIMVKVQDYVFAIHQDTTTVDGFPFFINDGNQSGTHSPSPVIDDFDNDGDVEFAFASIAGMIYFFDLDSAYNNNFAFWNSYKHDQQNTSAAFPIEAVTEVSDENNSLPKEFVLLQNYPNPFNPVTKIKFQIPSLEKRVSPLGEDGELTKLKVYDILGSEVTTLVNEIKPPGFYEVEFNAANLPSGVYIYILRSGSFVQSKKMLLLK